MAATNSHGAISQQSIDVTVTDARERGKAPVGWHDDGHRAFAFDKDFGGKMSGPGHQQTTGIEHHPFADIHAMMEAAHTLAVDAATQADAGHNPMLEHFLPHQPNAHDALLG